MEGLSGKKDDLFLLWGESIHLFPKNLLPPLLVESPVSTQGFSPEFQDKFILSQKRNSLVSKILWGESVAQRKDFSKSFSAGDVFPESEMQKLLS